MSDKTKEQFLAEAFHPVQGIETGNLLKALKAYADQEKRKEAIAFLNSVTDEGCNNYFKIGDSWFLGEDEHDEDPEGPFTSDQIYDAYLQHIALVNKNKN